ncbi:MAG: hypothetical protein HOH77_07010, partial [Candidatus Latescibacteria bacterium]|nr:hypothetical protein [Candidatus Latescibacterota bacterium]
TIAYEQTGDQRDDVAYVELDLQGVDAGEQNVRVEVVDNLTGQKVSKEILFEIVP